MNRHSYLLRSLPTAFAVTTSLLFLSSTPTQAACTLTPGVGNDDFNCDSGSSGPLTDLSGNNSLTFPANGTGSINGSVSFGAGADRVVMESGSIVDNLVTGSGSDTIIVSGGRIGGNVSANGGNDSITVTGGEIAGEIRASTGNDRLVWDTGGLIRSAILMGEGNDSAMLRNIDEATLSTAPSLDGESGNDVLTFDNSTSAGPARYINWETVNLNNGSHFDLSGSFVLGDSATGTGIFNIDSSTLAVSQGSISPSTSGQLITLNNAGVIDMRTGNTRTDDTLTVQGNYVGDNGRLRLQSVLGDDRSASDKLVVNNGTLSGDTQITVYNLGGVGGLTQQNGIQLVQAQGTAVSDNQAFTLRRAISAGPYDYYLYKGGVTAGTENSWYLRSAVVAPADATVPVPVAATGTPELPAAVRGAAPIPLYRPEVPTWSVLPPAVAILTLTALGTFHDRQGDQRLLTETGAFSAGWGRVYGKSLDRTWAGTVMPRFDGSLEGFQIGNDLYGSHTSGGQTQRTGFFVGHTRLRGDVDGFNQGFEGRRAGKVELHGDSLGLYWTLTDPQGWYIDTVAMGTRLDGSSSSERGLEIQNKGHALTLSAEAGYPIALSGNWVVEPQVQLINQRISLDSQDDGISRVSFDSDTSWTGRLGARLKGRYEVNGMPVEPYLRSNFWHTFSGTDTVSFDHTNRIKTEQKSSSADIGIGLIVSISSSVSLYTSADYSSKIDGNDLEGVVGNLGVRVSW